MLCLASARPLFLVVAIGSLWFGCSRPALADVESGPTVGSATPALKVLGVVGKVTNETADFTPLRAEKPTLFLFVHAERWNRPLARLMKELDQQLAEVAPEGEIIAVWVGGDTARTKEYLPLAQRSLQFVRTQLSVDERQPFGPAEWNINTEADLTVVVASAGKVQARFAYTGPNDALSKEILAAMK